MDGKSLKKKHDLKSLFDALSPVSKDAVRKNHQEVLKTSPSMRDEFARLRQCGENPDEIFDFDGSLQKSAKAFEQSRYPFDPSYETHTYLAAPIGSDPYGDHRSEPRVERLFRVSPISP